MSVDWYYWALRSAKLLGKSTDATGFPTDALAAALKAAALLFREDFYTLRSMNTQPAHRTVVSAQYCQDEEVRVRTAAIVALGSQPVAAWLGGRDMKHMRTQLRRPENGRGSWEEECKSLCMHGSGNSVCSNMF